MCYLLTDNKWVSWDLFCIQSIQFLERKETSQTVYRISKHCKRFVTLHGKTYTKVLTDDIIYDLFVIHLNKAQVCLPNRLNCNFQPFYLHRPASISLTSLKFFSTLYLRKKWKEHTSTFNEVFTGWQQWHSRWLKPGSVAVIPTK